MNSEGMRRLRAMTYRVGQFTIIYGAYRGVAWCTRPKEEKSIIPDKSKWRYGDDFYVVTVPMSKPIVDEPKFKQIDLEEGGFPMSNPFSPTSSINLYKLLEAIEAASYDEHVTGIHIKYSPKCNISIVHASELRDAIMAYRARTKLKVVFSCDYFSDGFSLVPYYLASACDRISINPGVSFILGGLSAPGLYFKTVLEKLGVEVVTFSRGKYKSAIEPLSSVRQSEAAKENMTSLLSSMLDSIIKGIAKSRSEHLTEEDVVAAIKHSGTFTSKEAVAKKLVDQEAIYPGSDSLPLPNTSYNVPGFNTADDIKEHEIKAVELKAKQRADWVATLDDQKKEGLSNLGLNPESPGAYQRSGLYAKITKGKYLYNVWNHGDNFEYCEGHDATYPRIEWGSYMNKRGRAVLKKRLEPMVSSSPKIAVVYINGAIDNTVMKRACGALLAARDDERIQAIILRIDSPGGSAIDGEMISQTVAHVNSIKPIVASMGLYAASAGYMIAAPATVIVANEATVTGSIGVFGVLPSVHKLLKNHEVGFDLVSVGGDDGFTHFSKGAAANWFDSKDPGAVKARTTMERNVDDFYSRFKATVSHYRKMTLSQVEDVAQGRTWTGVQALKIGLVDEVGGWDAAILAAKKLAAKETFSKSTPEASPELYKEYVDLVTSSPATVIEFPRRDQSYIRTKLLRYVESFIQYLLEGAPEARDSATLIPSSEEYILRKAVEVTSRTLSCSSNIAHPNDLVLQEELLKQILPKSS
jgi:signal peptide peptidase SppA